MVKVHGGNFNVVIERNKCIINGGEIGKIDEIFGLCFNMIWSKVWIQEMSFSVIESEVEQIQLCFYPNGNFWAES